MSLNLIVTQPTESEYLPWDKIKRQAQRIGHHIALQGDSVTKVVAEVTSQPLAIKLVKAAGAGDDVVSLMSQPETWVAQFIEADSDERHHVNVVSISNALFESHFLQLLNLEEDELQELRMMQSQCCCLIAIKSSPVAKLPLKVATIIPSSALPKTFEFETDTGVEQRKRPAYYYRQSGVIPWRINNEDLQIMVVTSSKNKHWGFPKGIVEPGLSQQQSASVEAFEEAGIRGEVGQALGQFKYDKWGAECVVDIYTMKVSEVLSKSQWQENYRNRHWCSVSLAKHLVKNPGYVDLIDKLDVAYRANQLLQELS